MKLSVISLCFLVAVALPLVKGQTENIDTTSPETTAPPGATVITSDELHLDQVSHTSVFTGNVVVVGTNFNMKCEEMTVYSTTGNKIDHILAKGNVVILQPGRITHCGQAIYYHDDDKFVLTDQPDILDNNNEIRAPEITIFRTQKTLQTKGRTWTRIIDRGTPSSSTNSVTTPAAP